MPTFLKKIDDKFNLMQKAMVKLEDPQPLGGVAKFKKLSHLRSCVKSMEYS